MWGAVLAATLSFTAAGCSMLRGDFAPRTAPTVVSTGPDTVAPLEVRPAVLVDGGGPSTVATVTPPRTSNVDALPPLPKDTTAFTGSTPSAINSKTLSPEEKARVIAELEALARGETPAPTAVAVARPECVTPRPGEPPATAAAASAAAAAGCVATPKPAIRP
jgi:hypothetical protein